MARKSANVAEVQEMNEEQVYDVSVDTTEEDVSTEDLIYLVDDIKEKMDALNIMEIREIIDYGCELVKEREEKEVSELDRQIQELKAKREQIRPQPVQQIKTGKKREIKALINPKNPDEKYSVGKHPSWLLDWLKETLGEKSEDKAAVWNQISQWKQEQQ
jgi:hypothetical protein